ncbi:MAG TPA: SPFH domain-containing protein [Acholeplasmataceae bacterium]|nr:SPFH domain-containing protein [Acholeplasmataceae bacterium]
MPTGVIVLLIVLGIVLLIAVIVALSSVKIVKQAQIAIVERLGRYYKTWETGIHFLIPFFDRISLKISLKEQIIDYDPQPVITKDNVTMQIDSVVYYQITDAKLYAYGVENPRNALANLTATTLRNVIGAIDLDEALTGRELINSKLRIILDEATDPWGIKVLRVELKNIMPPKDIRDAMEKQMRAEREKREAILNAEGKKQAQILIAEGAKEAKVLEAQADKEARILAAEADKQSQILKAHGEAEAIRSIQEANAEGIRLIKAAGADESVLKIHGYNALVEVSKGQATKLIIPSELSTITSLVSSAKEVMETKPAKADVKDKK